MTASIALTASMWRNRDFVCLWVALTGSFLGEHAMTFLLAAILIATIRRPMQDRRDDHSAQGVLADIFEGFRYVWAHRLVRTIAAAVPSTSCWAVSSVS